MGQNVPLKSRVPHPIGRRQALRDPIFWGETLDIAGVLR